MMANRKLLLCPKIVPTLTFCRYHQPFKNSH
jgi:hypothetical protein